MLELNHVVTDSRGYEALTDGSPNELVMSPTKSRTPADIVDYGVDQHQPGPPLPMPLQSRPRPTPKKALSSKPPLLYTEKKTCPALIKINKPETQRKHFISDSISLPYFVRCILEV